MQLKISVLLFSAVNYGEKILLKTKTQMLAITFVAKTRG